MRNPLVEYFRCPDHVAEVGIGGRLPAAVGYFRFGDAIGYGRQSAAPASSHVNGNLVDVSRAVASVGGRVLLPFDLDEVLGNLRYERYARPSRTRIERMTRSDIAHAVYYAFRPVLPVSVRKHLQRLSLNGWRRIEFPRWPVDVSVETLMKHAVRLVLEKGRTREFPFIWFWPDGAPGGAMVTHDVEGQRGADRAGALMDLDDEFGIRSSFQVVPEAKGSRRLLERCRRRGFEVNLHDLNHDGHLFRDRALFERRAREINRHAREYGCRGFRSGAMYRRQEWFSALEVAFDMSVPNVAHLEPQQGGCCTVMPHFIGDVLELPLTTAQDYSLFHVLGDYSIDLWREQIGSILANNGLVSVIVHPDYQDGPRERGVYVELLRYLAQLRDERHMWVASPSEIDAWWRRRREMRLVADGASWRIEGPGAERARVAWARLEGGRVVYEIDRARRAA